MGGRIATAALLDGGVLRLGRAFILAILVVGCGASLSDGAWVWCQANERSVDHTAAVLNMLVRPTYSAHCEAAAHPSSGPFDKKSLDACQDADADFIKACRAAAKDAGGPGSGGEDLSGAEAEWCNDEGVKVAAKASSMGLTVPGGLNPSGSARRERRCAALRW